MRTVTAGAATQVILLALLTMVTGLSPSGWLAAIVVGAAGWAALAIALRRLATQALGPADRVTLARAVLVGCVTAMVADTVHQPAHIPLLVSLAAVALVMDAVDGRVARRTRTASPLGARLDMEVDAFLILVLSVFVATSLGGWVLAIGGMRYAFAAAGRPLAWLRAPLPPSMARKAVAAAQGIVLTVITAGVLPHLVAIVVTGLALVTLIWSFGLDIGWLYRHRATEPVPVGSDHRHSLAAGTSIATGPAGTSPPDLRNGSATRTAATTSGVRRSIEWTRPVPAAKAPVSTASC
jgi:phosphatidylglycerophosphate synthase